MLDRGRLIDRGVEAEGLSVEVAHMYDVAVRRGRRHRLQGGRACRADQARPGQLQQLPAGRLLCFGLTVGGSVASLQHFEALLLLGDDRLELLQVIGVVL